MTNGVTPIIVELFELFVLSKVLTWKETLDSLSQNLKKFEDLRRLQKRPRFYRILKSHSASKISSEMFFPRISPLCFEISQVLSLFLIATKRKLSNFII